MKKALIIQNKFIGDVLVASMIAENLKHIYPDIQVDFFCFEPAKEILENNPNINQIIYFDDTELKKTSNLWHYTKIIRNERYDILIDSYAKLQSRFITFFSKAKYKVSYNKPFFKYFYTHVYHKHQAPSCDAYCTAVDDRLMLLSPFTKDFKQLPIKKPSIYLSKQELLQAKALLKNNGIDFNKPIFVIGVMGSGMDKTWPLDYMATLINHLTKYYEVDLIFNYTPSQKQYIDQIFNQISDPSHVYPNVLGKSIREFAAILSHCSGIIANEGGAINTAKSLDTPSFSIYSPHKFRENWGCYESETKHQSVHLQDFNPKVFTDNSLRKLLNNPQPFYQKLKPEMVIEKLDQFLQENNFRPKQAIQTPQHYRPQISAVLITKNEQRNMPTYLYDFSFADEIVVVDSYSTDATKAIATANPKVKFLEREFDNFSSQKNFAIAQAQHEWILFFDTDERLTIDLKNEILTTVRDPNALDAYFIYRKFYLKNTHVKYSGWQNDKAVRLFKKSKNQYDTKKMVHETMVCQGSVGYLKNRLLHYSFANEQEYANKLELYSRLRAKQLKKEGLQPNWFHFHVKPAFRFLHHFVFRYGFLDGANGYKIAKLHSKSVRQRYDFLKQMID